MSSSVQKIYDAVAGEHSRRANVDLFGARYYPEIFGNFIISFRIAGCDASLVNERFELFICNQLGGEGDRHTLARDIRERTPAEVLASINDAL